MRGDEWLEMVSRLPDEALGAELARLAGSCRSTTAALSAHLAEFGARQLHLSAGFRSLFRYCTESLRLSEHAAYNRIEAAHAARRFPQVVDRIEEGSLNLTTVRLLSPHLTEENQEDLLASAAFKSKSEVQELIARRFPRSDVPATIRKLPTPPRAVNLTVASTALPALLTQDGAVHRRAADPEGAAVPTRGQPSAPHRPEVGRIVVAEPAPRGDVVRPLAADRYEIRFTATGATREKLRIATDMLRHAVPDGDLAEIVDRALTVLLDDLARRKFATVRQGLERTASPDAAQPASAEADVVHSRTRHIPATIKRAVWLRDGGRCAFVARNGRRCDACALIEFHHVDPYAVGGAATVDNIQLRCRAHNAYEADLFYGRREPTSVQAPSTDRGPRPELVPERGTKGDSSGDLRGLANEA
jgi:hypothetical protein